MRNVLHFVIIGSCMTGPCFYRFKNIPYKIILRGVMLCKNNCKCTSEIWHITISKKSFVLFFSLLYRLKKIKLMR